MRKTVYVIYLDSYIYEDVMIGDFATTDAAIKYIEDNKLDDFCPIIIKKMVE